MRILFTLFSVFLLFMPTLAQDTETEEEKKKRLALLKDLTEANRLYVDKKYPQAEKKFDEILKEYPENLEAHIGKMDILRARKKQQDAVSYAKTQRSKAKTDTHARHVLEGMVQLMDKEFDVAMEAFKTGSETFPEEAYLSHYYQGYIHYLHKRLDKAIPHLEETAKLNEDYADAYYLLGDIYLKKKNNAKALENWNKYLELVPHVGSRYTRVSRVVKQLGGR